MRKTLRFVLGAFLVTALAASTALAQTGKISGRVTDAASGDALPGVNVVIQGTTMGATTNADGYYNILNVPPGTYTVEASFVGFATARYEGVEVNIDLTTQRNFQLQEQTQQLQEVTVQATEPVVKPDVSANVANIDPQQFENMPVAGVEEVVSLQAGIEPGMSIRGGSLSELSFVVDGMSMRTGRDNNPFTSVSYTSVAEMQVQTGGFAAEYGNVRAGLINVVTKDAPRSRYTVDAMVRYEPIQQKSRFGTPNDPESFFQKPYLPEANQTWNGQDVPADQNPALVGEGNSIWDAYEGRQYPDFEGWNNIVNRLAEDGDPNNDLTVDQLVEIFKFRTRKPNGPQVPDYVADVTVGGPLIPGLSDNLGDLRFLASYRRDQTAYIYPQQRDKYVEQVGQFKLTTNFTSSMKLTLNGMLSSEQGMVRDNNDPEVNLWHGNMPTYPWSWTWMMSDEGFGQTAVYFAPESHNPGDIDHRMVGGEFTHTLGANTFYTAKLQRMYSEYRSQMPRARNLERNAFCVDSNEGQGLATPGVSDNQYCVDEAPYGFAGAGGNIRGAGFTTGGHFAKTRDTTNVAIWQGEFDLTSQLNRFMQIKTGADLVYSQHEIRVGQVNLALGGVTKGLRRHYDRQPIQGAAYGQTKLEFQGMIANVGVRLDYLDVNDQWWQYDAWPLLFKQRIPTLNANLPKEPTESQLHVSPRIGVSFPVTEDSKLYFNYGHFRNMPNPSSLFGVQQSLQGGIDVMGNPGLPMPKTVAYELGYDQNLADMFLLRISGFYRDIRDQQRNVTFTNLDGSVTYDKPFAWDYEDIRGFEISLNKNTGRWFRGFANFTFQSQKEGDFGFGQFYENTFQQRTYLRTSTDYTIFDPVPQPFARLNFEFLVPQEIGPEMGGLNPLGNWRATFLATWREGDHFTWAGPGGGAAFPQLNNNVSWRDWYNFDLRVTKRFSGGWGDVQLFADITNVFGIKHLYRETAFQGNRDYQFYLESLHMPADIFPEDREPPYQWVHGDDQPGDFRQPGVEFQPIEVVKRLDLTPDRAKNSPRAWVYDKQTGDYYTWTGSSFEEVPDGDVEEALDNKAYIDMPNQDFATFLNPRRVMFGLRFSF